MHIAVIDDNSLVHEQFHQWLPYDTIDCFLDGMTFLEALREKSYDAIFLDVILPDLMGFVVGERVRAHSDYATLPIVYLSAQTDYCLDLFSTQAFDFLQKPLTTQAIHQCMNQLEFFHLNQSLSFHKGQKTIRISQKDILYIEAISPKLLVHCLNDIIEVQGSLSDLDYLSERFLRIHQSFLVNVSHVARIQVSSVKLFNGEELTVSRSFRKSIREYLFQLQRR